MPQTWDVESRGLPHTRQVIVREKLNLKIFTLNLISGEISFRIIFTNRGLKPRNRASDPRIALAVPRFKFDAVAETERVSSALSMPPTTNRRDPLIDQVFRTKQESRLAAPLTRIVESYANGRLYRQNQSLQSGREFFAANSIEQCVTEVAVLRRSHPKITITPAFLGH